MIKRTRPITKAASIRLPLASWPKIRAITNHHGRAWFVKWIEKTFDKLPETAKLPKAES